jgi:hypothetical protein
MDHFHAELGAEGLVIQGRLLLSNIYSWYDFWVVLSDARVARRKAGVFEIRGH